MEKEKSLVEKAKDFGKDIMDTEESKEKFTKKDVEDGKVMAVISYLGILALIPFFAEKRNKYVKYHAKQGMNFMVVSIGYSIISAILSAVIKVNDCGDGYWADFAEKLGANCKVTPWWVTWPLSIIGIGFGIIAIIGIINAIKGRAKELPLVNKVKIFK